MGNDDDIRAIMEAKRESVKHKERRPFRLDERMALRLEWRIVFLATPKAQFSKLLPLSRSPCLRHSTTEISCMASSASWKSGNCVIT